MEHELNVKNSNLSCSDDTSVQASNKSNPDNMSDVIDEPPDHFFSDVLTDDFLDSLAVVDAWDPDADESDAETIRHANNGQSPTENKINRGDETISKDSEYKGKGNGVQSDNRKLDGASVETRHNSKERTTHRIGKGDTDEQKHNKDKDKQEGHEKTRDRSRERGKETIMDNKERDISRIIKGDRTHMERSVHRRDRKSKDKSTERIIYSYSSNRENRDESRERSVDRKQRDKNIERSVQADDKDKNIVRASHRYSYQYRVSNRGRSADISAKDRNCDLRHSVSNARARGICDTVYRRQESPKEVNRRGDGSNESHRNEKNPDLSLNNRESRRESVKSYHSEKGTSDALKHVSENRMTEIAAVSQQHMITKCNIPPLNNMKLDTCIKELADVVPPGTENDFILSTKDESVKMVDDIKNRYITDGKDNSKLLAEETKGPVVLDSEKSCKHPVVKSESQNKEIYVIGEKNDEHNTLERNDSEKASLCTSGQQPHREGGRVSSPHERRRMRSDPKRSDRRSSASRSRMHGHSDEGKRKRRSSSLERIYEVSRIRNEQFNEQLRKKRLLESYREESCRRSRSRERQQYHSDLNRLMIKDDQNDTRRSQSRSVVKQHEVSEGQERLGRSGSWDKHYRRTLNDSRRSEFGSRDKQRELSVGRERLRRSASRDRHFRRASSAERWQPNIEAQRSNKKMDNNSRRSVRSLSREKQSETFLPIRISRSRSRDRERRNEYRYRRERSRKSSSLEVEKKRSLMQSRRSPSWDRHKHRALELSPVSVGHMPLSPSISFDLSSISSEREPKRRSSRSRSRERRSQSFVSLSSVSDDSQYRRHRRKRSPFWKELERQFTKDLCKSYYNQSAEYSSGAGTANFEQGCSSSVYPAQSTFLPAAGPYPSDHAVYSHNYSSEPSFTGAVIHPPQNHVASPTVVSAASFHPETTQIMPPTSLPPPVYDMPLPAPMGCPGQPAPFVNMNEFPSTENRFSQPYHTTEKLQGYPQVPPPPNISQPGDKNQMSLSSLLEASVKVGGSAKRKATSVDPALVVRCEEAIQKLEKNDRLILVSPGHLVLQESSKPHSTSAAVLQASLEDTNKFRSPMLRTPDPQLSFTTPPVRDEDTSEPSRYLPKKDITVSVKGGQKTGGAPFERRAVPSRLAAGSTQNSKLFVNSSKATHSRGDEKKLSDRQKCSSCSGYMDKIMVWNSTQTSPSMDIGDKIMVWNSTQTPHTKVKNVGVQVQIVKLGTLHRFVARKKRKLNAVNDVRRDTAVNKRSSYYNSSKTADSFSDMTPTAAAKEDRSEASSESKQQSPKRSGLSTSGNEAGHKGKDSFYKPSPYQARENGRDQRSYSLYSSGDKGSAVSSASSQRTVAPKGILKPRSDMTLQQPAPSPQLPWQHSLSQPKCDFPESSLSSPLQASKPFTSSGSLREFGRSGSDSLGGMGTSIPMQPISSNLGMFGGTAGGFPEFGNPDIRGTPDRDQSFFGLHHNQFSSLHRGSSNPGAGPGMQPFQHQMSMVFPQAGNPSSMMPHDADTLY